MFCVKQGKTNLSNLLWRKMSAQVHLPNHCIFLPPTSLHTFSVLNSSRENKVLGLGRSFLGLNERILLANKRVIKRKKDCLGVIASAGGAVWDGWMPEKTSKAPPLSDIFWPSAGAFAVMAMLGKIDQILAPKGISMTIAPLGAVCAVLFATPSSPGARKYNIFMAQIGCAAIGVLAFTILGPGWLARSAALSAAMAFMIFTRSVHPPAASLPLLFIDGAKLHQLNYWYALFPGAAGCILLCLLEYSGLDWQQWQQWALGSGPLASGPAAAAPAATAQPRHGQEFLGPDLRNPIMQQAPLKPISRPRCTRWVNST